MKSLDDIRNEQDAIRDEWFDEWNRTGVKPAWDFEPLMDQIYVEWLLSLAVGDRAHVKLYSDVEPCTVVKRTAKSITVRYDKGHLNGSWKPEVVLGGFVGHCTNNYGQLNGGWDIEDDPEGSLETFRWSAKDSCWKSNGVTLAPGWVKFHDYNF